MLPDSINFKHAKDPWHAAFNGLMSDYKVVYGPGAYLSGFPSYQSVMYRNNPRSIILGSVAKTYLVQIKQDEEKNC